jgi:ribonuclease P protein component
MPRENSLKRSSILKHQLEIQTLFSNGKRDYADIVKIIWTSDKVDENAGIKIFVSVPKRNIKKATSRNLLKRRIREALRQNLSNLRSFCKENNLYVKVGIVYSKNCIEEYNKIEQKIVLSLQKIYSTLYESINQ